MALTIGQIAAVAYPAVLNEQRKPEDQFSENALLSEMQRQGMIKSRAFGETLQLTLDYRRNPGGKFLTTDVDEMSLAKTEVITAAEYAIGELGVPVMWTKKDEVQTPSENQKVAFVDSLLTNAISTHDDLIEEALLAATSTEGVHSALVLIPENGAGTVGGIDASTETWWANAADTYLADGSDIEAVLTEVWNTASKGSGSKLSPTLLFSGSDAHALFESTQVPYMRYDSQDIKAGAKSLMFKTAKYIFSHFGDDHVFMVNPKTFSLYASKQYFRDKGEQREMEKINGFSFKLYSALQLATSNKSRLAVAYEA